MIEYYNQPVYIENANKIFFEPPKNAPTNGSIAYKILAAHNVKQDSEQLHIKFDSLASHDITYVGIIQTVRAANADFERFPLPYVLTNCHNSLCAVGGTTNEDDHVFGLSAAKKYGGVFVPPHIAVIHQYIRETMTACGRMILGSDSHTRYGALGTMGFGEGGGELVKQLLGKTYDINKPEVVAVYLTGNLRPGVGAQDVALSLIGKVFAQNLTKNKILEFIGPGIANLSIDYRLGIDVMTTETACLSSIWATDSKVEEFYANHGRLSDYSSLQPDFLARYDSLIKIDLSLICPMIAMPFHPSNVFPIATVQKNAADILRSLESNQQENLSHLQNLCLPNGNIKVDQAIIAGCSGGMYEFVAEAAEILENHATTMTDAFSLSVYPASQPIYLATVENGIATKLLKAGAVLKTAFCGPCFGAGDVPKHNGFSIRHATRNFPSREGAKPNLGQTAAVALMDALSVAATATNQGVLTSADELLAEKSHVPKYYFNSEIYKKRVYNGTNAPQPATELIYSPGIRDWPKFAPLADNILLAVAAFITDAVTTTDELIPSGETSTFRSNPYLLAEYTLSRKVPSYVNFAKKVATWEETHKTGDSLAEIPDNTLQRALQEIPQNEQFSIGTVIYAKKPGDGSAREQAASCQRVLGGFANIAQEYATKRYRSNLINWGLLPFILPNETNFEDGDFIYISNIKKAVENQQNQINGFVFPKNGGDKKPIALNLPLTKEESRILLDGCLINHFSK
ncbi:MAG: hydratase [Firmicutes bacterium]|nr:hydratase [Bacillota bacterium]